MSKRTAFVTGASQGIGAAIAAALARDGCDVAVSSTRPGKLASVITAIEAEGRRAVAVPLDVRSQASIEQALSVVIDHLGELDILVNNAAIPLRKDALDITRDEWEQVLDTDLKGAFFMTQQMGRHLVQRGCGGCIISVSSTHGLVGAAGRAAYGIAKASLLHMTRMLAIEWAEYGIRLNAVAPGRVETASRAGSLFAPGYRDWALNRVPLHRFATAEEVAAAVSYLASPAAAYITGQTLVLDGGLTAC
jgi:NAD(P)-dependent dehydrogenase (short-subunit alcohol dehydrogenase family)